MKFKPSLLACAVLSGLVGLTGCNDDTTNIYESGDTNPALPDIPDGGKPVCPPVGDGDCDDKPNPETPEIDMGVHIPVDFADMDVTRYVNPFIGTGNLGNTYLVQPHHTAWCSFLQITVLTAGNTFQATTTTTHVLPVSLIPTFPEQVLAT